MKMTTPLLALIAGLSFVSLIGCDKKDDNPQATAAKCMATIGCPQGVMSAMGANAQTQAMALNGGVQAPTLLPPAAGNGAPTVLSNNTQTQTVPQVIASISNTQLRQAASSVAKQMAAASANPNSSYYVDPNAQDIPARNSNESINTVPVVRAASRSPASVEPSSDPNVTQ